MQANRSDTPRVLPPTMLISLSRRVTAFAAIMLILLDSASAQFFPARNWEIGTDIYYKSSTKTVGYTSDPEVLILELPAGQSEISQRFSLAGPPAEILDQLQEGMEESDLYMSDPEANEWLLDARKLPLLLETVVEVSAEGEVRPFEVIIEAIWDWSFLGVVSEIPSKMTVEEYQGTYTDVSVPSPDESFVWTNVYSTRAFQRRNFGVLIESIGVEYQLPLAIVVTLREVPVACWMQVTYWGDVEGTNSGDLAYFNNFLKEGSLYAEQGGVYRATGSAADPAAQPLIDQFMDIAGGAEPTSVFSEEVAAANSGSAFDSFSDYSNPELEELVEQNNEAQQQQQQQATSEFAYWIGGKGQVPDDELETFGVTMAGRQVSQTDDRAADMARGVGQLATASVLLAATRAHLSWMPVMPDRETWNEDVPLSRLEFRPLAMGALFRWEEGKPGSGTLRLSTLKNGVLYGRITGTLYSREMRRPDDSDSEISIRADFIAAEGALTCDLPVPTKILK